MNDATYNHPPKTSSGVSSLGVIECALMRLYVYRYKIIPPAGGIIFRELYQALLPGSTKDGFIAIVFIYIVFSIQVANNLFSIRASKDASHTSFYFTTMDF